MRLFLLALVAFFFAAPSQSILVWEASAPSGGTFSPFYTFDAELTSPDCTGENGVGSMSLGGTTVNCDQAVTVLGGSETLEWSGTYASAYIFSNNEYDANRVESGVVQVRMAIQLAAANGTATYELLRSYDNFSPSGVDLTYNGSTDVLSVACDVGSSGVGTTTLANGTPYWVTIVYDVDADDGELYLSTTPGDHDTSGTPEATCNGTSVDSAMDGMRMFAPDAFPYYLDDVQVGLNP